MASSTTPWSGTGIILSFPHLTSSKLSPETLQQWLQEDYIPALHATSTIDSAWLYKAANLSYNKQHLVIYKVPDVSTLQSGKLAAVPRTSKQNLFEGSVDQHVTFDTRIYSFVQRFELGRNDDELSPTLLLALMQPSPRPGGAEDLDKWYRDEHNQQMSEQPGWKRTERFGLVSQHNNAAETQKVGELSFLAIHGFGEQHELGIDVLAVEPVSEWTKKVMAEAEGIDAAIFRRVGRLGA